MTCQAVLENETSERKKLSMSFFVWMVRSDEKMFLLVLKFSPSCKRTGTGSVNFVRQQCQALRHRIAPIFRIRMRSDFFCQADQEQYDHLSTNIFKIRSIVAEIQVFKEAW